MAADRPAGIPGEIAAQLAGVQAILDTRLGAGLVALHLFGSAVDGGLKPASDIDLLVTVSAPLSEATRRALMRDLLALSAWPGSSPTHRALEVTIVDLSQVLPWRYPPMRELQFGEWLRDELQAGDFPGAEPDPDLAILLTKARLHSINLAGPPASALFPPVPREDLVRALGDTIAQWRHAPDWLGDERNIVLALARIWFSAETGGIASKDAAASWALPRLPEEHRAVLHAARAAYLDGSDHGLAEDADQLTAYIGHVQSRVAEVLGRPERG